MTTATDPRHAFTEALIADFRANAGHATSGPFLGKDLLLLTTTGAKSGVQHTTPLVYSRDGDRIIIIASKGGADTHPSWYHNVAANPVVTIEVGREKFDARATVANAAERRRLYDAHAAINPGFLEYELKTTRTIPVIELERVGVGATR